MRRVFADPHARALGHACPPMRHVGARPAPRRLGAAPVRHAQRERYARPGRPVHGGLAPMKPLRIAVARPRQPLGVPDDPRRRGVGRLPLLPRRRSCPPCSSSSRPRGQRITFFVVGQDAALDREREGRSGRSPRPATRSATTRSATSPGSTGTRPTRSTTSCAGPRTPSSTSPASAPSGFRGPGYSLSDDVLRVLVDRGYRYDCSTLPTVIGPLAREYYFRTRQAHRRAARRARLPLRRVPGRACGR